VPTEFIASEPGLLKKCHRLKGTAGPKRMRLSAEVKKEMTRSKKIQFLQMEESSGAAGGRASANFSAA
jgi:hypothetical protein